MLQGCPVFGLNYNNTETDSRVTCSTRLGQCRRQCCCTTTSCADVGFECMRKFAPRKLMGGVVVRGVCVCGGNGPMRPGKNPVSRMNIGFQCGEDCEKIGEH